MRAASTDVLEDLQRQVEQLVSSIAERYGTDVSLKWEDVVPAALVGEEAEANLRAAIVATAGNDSVVEQPVTPGSNDFHFYTLHRPELQAAMLGVGADLQPGLHDPNMSFDTACLEPAVRVLEHAVLNEAALSAGETES